MIDDKGKLFGLINVLDLMVLVLVLAVGAGIVFRLAHLGAGTRPGAQERPAEVVVLIEGVRQATLDVIKVGDVMKEFDTSAVFGTVTRTEVRPSQQVIPTSDGRNVVAVVPEKFDLVLYLDVRASVTPDAIVIARKETRVGSSVRLKTQLAAVMTTVMSIRFTD
jgi:hypothetical protein